MIGWLAALLGRMLWRLMTLSLLLVIVVGVPVGLWTQVGWPLPHTLPAGQDLLVGLTSPVTDTLIINTLAAVCWLAWAQFTVSLLVETVAVVRHRPAPHLALTGPLQPLAARLAGVLLVGVLAFAHRSTGGPPAPAATISAPADLTHLRPLLAIPPQPDTVDPDQPRLEELPRHTVRPRQTLWGIAETRLGDGLRWREIFALNEGLLQPDGDRLTDPGLIRPGWRLYLPPDAQALPRQPGPPAAPDSNDANRPQPPVPSPTPTTVPGPTQPTTPPTSQAPPSPPPAPAEGPAGGPSGVVIELPSGSVVCVSFAAGMLTQWLLARLRARRRYQPRPPAPGVRHHDPALEPDPTMRQLMQGLHRLHDAATTDTPNPAAGQPAEAAAGQPANGRTPAAGAAQPAGAVGPVAVGDRDGQELVVDLVAMGAVRLLGPGAAAAGRAILAAHVAADGPMAAEALIVGDGLLAEVGPFPGLRRASDLSAAQLDTELAYRAELLEDAEAADVASYRQHGPDEPLPTLLILLDAATPPQPARLQHLLAHGPRLGIGMVLLDADAATAPTAATLEVTATGQVVTATPQALCAQVERGRLSTLTEQDAVSALAVLARARAEDPDAEAQRAPAPTPDASDPPSVRLVVSEHPAGSTAEASVSIRLLGAYQITTSQGELGRVRDRSRELLAYTVLHHPDGVRREAATEALWPQDAAHDAPASPEQVASWFHVALNTLRRRVRDATGVHRPIILRSGRYYRVDPALVAVDLWAFEAALEQADTHPGDPAAQAAALQQAAEVYQGDLLADEYYAWVEVPREELRRRALDAVVRLAELAADRGDDQAAAGVLEQAITIDPVAEECYRRLMRTYGRLGRFDAARRTFRRLEARLSDLAADPEPATRQLLVELRDTARPDQHP